MKCPLPKQKHNKAKVMIVNGWRWPDNDTKLIQVLNQVNDIDHIMTYVENRSVCVQAGGACGVWPHRFAQLFDEVYTFEPVEENYNCMVDNLYHLDNVAIFPSALSDDNSTASMSLHASEAGNAGAWYLTNGDDVHTMTIDSLELDRCGLIQLDVEGHEYEALKGATRTIQETHPIIVIEEKPLPQTSRDVHLARRYLESIGYNQIGAIHRDVIFG